MLETIIRLYVNSKWKKKEISSLKSQLKLVPVDPSCTMIRDFLQFFHLRTLPPDIPKEGSGPPLPSLLQCHLPGLLSSPSPK